MSDTDDDMIVQCEACDAKHHMDESMITDDGCNICPKCAAEWRQTVAACKHDWRPQADQYGDPGQYCTKCFVIVLDCNMPDFLAGKIAL